MARLVTSRSEVCFLEIAIPTYNRCEKLERLLSILQGELEGVSDNVSVRISVSDNHSSDGTAAMLTRHDLRDRIVVRRQAENVGALLNIWSLYATAAAEYVWVISDDDMPAPGSMQRIVQTLEQEAPTVLTFEFDQPPGSKTRRHGPKTGLETLADLSAALPQVLVFGKLTKQVFRAADLHAALASVERFRNTGYGWLLVIVEVLNLASQPLVVVDHSFLAGSDGEYRQVTNGLVPQFWDDYLLVLEHELITAHCKDYVAEYKYAHPIYMVRMLYGVMEGSIAVADKSPFRAAAARLPFLARYLRNPGVALQWATLRLGLPATPLVSSLGDGFTSLKRHFRRVVGA